jgi:HAD superfamily hydrolase (TIGR01549 family)
LRRKIAAITFDLWNTLYSGEIGAADKVRPKRVAAVGQALAESGVAVTDEQLKEVYSSGYDAYLAAWSQGRHYGAREQVLHILSRFGVNPREDVLTRAAWAIEEASRLSQLTLLPGVVETIPWLSQTGIRLGIISDTSLTPGRILVEYLQADGLLDYFSALTFSDETGFPKPDPRMFTRTLDALGVAASNSAHVGDMPRTDVAGAKAAGMLAIRCAAAVDHPEPPEADFVIKDHRELPGILTSVAQEPAPA